MSDEPLNPTTFDFSAWLRGVRPARRKVRLYARGDLVAEMDALMEGIDSAPDRAEREAELERLTEAFEESACWFTLEARSSQWRTKFRSDYIQAHGFAKRGEEDCAQDADQIELNLAQICAQLVEPKVTLEQMKALFEAAEPEVLKLVSFMRLVNDEPANGVTADFSRRLSGGSRSSFDGLM